MKNLTDGGQFPKKLEASTKVFCAAFLYLQFVFVIFWKKNIGKKLLI